MIPKDNVMSIRQIVGENIRCLRNKSGFTQEKLGLESGLHRDYIGRIERGLENISIDNLEKLALVFKIATHNLLIERWCFSL